MSTPGHERITYGKGGWVRYQAEGLPVPVFVRFELRNERLAPVDLFLPELEAGTLNAVLLRKVPLTRIESWVNEPECRSKVLVWLDRPKPDLRRAVGTFNAVRFDKTGTDQSDWLAQMYWAQVDDSGVRQPPQRRLADPLRLVNAEIPDATLEVPEGRPYGDDFYRSVADVFQSLLRHHRSPAGAMADANHVPMTTVHRWVKEARRRGFLPAGRQGKAG